MQAVGGQLGHGTGSAPVEVQGVDDAVRAARVLSHVEPPEVAARVLGALPGEQVGAHPLQVQRGDSALGRDLTGVCGVVARDGRQGAVGPEDVARDLGDQYRDDAALAQDVDVHAQIRPELLRGQVEVRTSHGLLADAKPDQEEVLLGQLLQRRRQPVAEEPVRRTAVTGAVEHVGGAADEIAEVLAPAGQDFVGVAAVSRDRIGGYHQPLGAARGRPGGGSAEDVHGCLASGLAGRRGPTRASSECEGPVVSARGDGS
ncbi:hypothetical protein AB0M94_36525 [Streptomyces xanthochromogenes]|uniref:hypothetical protein n=1 Tax=Streptomyces xanthochromogenes TaxID=67384 RepID=UPI00343C4CD6